MSCKLTLLLENTAPRCEKLDSEHGLSVFVETPNAKFVFDCGHTGIAWKNALKLGIDLTEVEFVILSHSHYDHAGGFPFLLNYCRPKLIFAIVLERMYPEK